MLSLRSVQELEDLRVGGNPCAEAVSWPSHGLNESNFPGLELMKYVNETLRELSLHDNNFTSQAFKFISDTVQLKDQLTKLDLSKNSLTGIVHHGALQTLFPNLKVSERSERALMKTSILAMNPAK